MRFSCTEPNNATPASAVLKRNSACPRSITLSSGAAGLHENPLEKNSMGRRSFGREVQTSNTCTESRHTRLHASPHSDAQPMLLCCLSSQCKHIPCVIRKEKNMSSNKGCTGYSCRSTGARLQDFGV